VPQKSTVGAGAFFSRVPKSVYIGCAAIALLGIVSLSLWLVLRDTWERDHGAELRQISEQTIALIRAGKNEDGVAKYEAMRALVGDRQLEDPQLRKALADAKELAEPTRRKVNEAKNLEHLRSTEDKAKAFAASGEIRRAIDAYREALDLIQQAGTGNPEFAKAIQRIAGPKQKLEDQLAAIGREEGQRKEQERKRLEQEAYDKEMVSKGYVRHKDQWMTREEYAKLTARGKLRVTATYFYNDFKGNVPNEAAVFAIPKEKGLQGKKIPGNFFWSLQLAQGPLRKLMDDVGGAFGWAGGDGKVELRLEPGSYEILVLMDVRPYFYSDLHKNILAQWFSSEFAESHAVLGRFATKTVEVYPNDITEASVNLK
jgi:hypothetical protein